jgi:hypothetical protein
LFVHLRDAPDDRILDAIRRDRPAPPELAEQGRHEFLGVNARERAFPSLSAAAWSSNGIEDIGG